jgi:hypothetical protein
MGKVSSLADAKSRCVAQRGQSTCMRTAQTRPWTHPPVLTHGATC